MGNQRRIDRGNLNSFCNSGNQRDELRKPEQLAFPKQKEITGNRWRTTLPASLALTIWALNSSSTWHAITFPSPAAAIPLLLSVPGWLAEIACVALLGFIWGACLAAFIGAATGPEVGGASERARFGDRRRAQLPAGSRLTRTVSLPVARPGRSRALVSVGFFLFNSIVWNSFPNSFYVF